MTDTENKAEPMRLRAEPPRVTRLSRKVLVSVGTVALVGIGGALIYALQTHDAGKSGEELYSTDNRQTADGLAGLPKDYTGPVLGPALPGDLGRPILSAQNAGQPVVPAVVPTPGVDEAEQERGQHQRRRRRDVDALHPLRREPEAERRDQDAEDEIGHPVSVRDGPA